MKPFRKLYFRENEDVTRLQESTAEAFRELEKDRFLSRQTISGISVSTAGTMIRHSLGRQPLGWKVTDQTADARVWRSSWDNETLTLDCSSTVTISLEVW
jgi:hypothetical protein